MHKARSAWQQSTTVTWTCVSQPAINSDWIARSDNEAVELRGFFCNPVFPMNKVDEQSQALTASSNYSESFECTFSSWMMVLSHVLSLSCISCLIKHQRYPTPQDAFLVSTCLCSSKQWHLRTIRIVPSPRVSSSKYSPSSCLDHNRKLKLHAAMQREVLPYTIYI